MNAAMILVLVSEEKNVLHANNNGSLIPIKDVLDGAEMGVGVSKSRVPA